MLLHSQWHATRLVQEFSQSCVHTEIQSWPMTDDGKVELTIVVYHRLLVSCPKALFRLEPQPLWRKKAGHLRPAFCLREV